MVRLFRLLCCCSASNHDAPPARLTSSTALDPHPQSSSQPSASSSSKPDKSPDVEQSSISQDKKDAMTAQFRSLTGASQTETLKYLRQSKYRLDAAVDSFYEAGGSAAVVQKPSPAPSTQNVIKLFYRYKDPEDTSEEPIGIDGTIKLCGDLGVEPEDVIMLALAFELKSPNVGEWPKQGWIDGFKVLKCDSIDSLKTALSKLRQKFGSDPTYFQKVYAYTFTFGLAQGQRSLPMEVATAFWELLLPFGLKGGALSHVDDLNDPSTSTYSGFKPEHIDWWIEFVQEKNVKGLSKDTWNMLIDFIRTIDDKFEKHDTEGSWPSLIDDFAEYARAKSASS